VKEEIRSRAAELGFDQCRFATAVPPESGPAFEQWLAEGQHGEMAYLARNSPKRVDPDKVLSGARSIVSLAVGYHRGQAPEARPMDGVIARYARSRDYHDVLCAPLKALTNFINEQGGEGTRSLWYVDTGPLLEREYAQRAGIGFVGKHTNVISPVLGNWFFLAEIITTVELPPDAPGRNRCGSCTRCLAACPTGAIPAPFQLDARKCISYLTIELKASIPEELRPAIGNRIYGCDDCLAVCPWNRFAREGRLLRDHYREDLDSPRLLELARLDEAGFRRWAEGTPMLRTKRRGLLRNVCVALGNVGEASALPTLNRLAGDTEQVIAEHARWAIAQIEKRAAKT